MQKEQNIDDILFTQNKAQIGSKRTNTRRLDVIKKSET